jgi:CheY-like chemotaxis protein/tRNA(Arg) A34 adenosine deaminase TadA
MSTDNSYHILIAEDNQVSRDMMTSVLKTKGYKVTGANDGDEAIELVGKHKFDLALVDINMAPTGGFDFARHLLVQGIELPVVIVTGDESSDMLVQASNLGVVRVLQKPVLPERLLHTVEKIFARIAGNSEALPASGQVHQNEPEDLMLRAIELAVDNALSGRGRAFGAVVADADGKIIGEGVNSLKSRNDPTAHAEILAIKQAVDKKGNFDLSDCTLYCSCEPTMMGKALIVSVGLPKVYHSLSQEDVTSFRSEEDDVKSELSAPAPTRTKYERICIEEGKKIFKVNG